MSAKCVTTVEQRDVLARLAGDVAETFEECGTFRTVDGFVSQRRLRISTYSFDHDFGTLILNEDGSLWADDGATRLEFRDAR